MRVMITGGGTGGHTSPAVAIIEALRRHRPDIEFLWVGRRGAIEDRVSAANQVPFRGLPVEGWPRRRTLRRLWVASKLAAGTACAAWLLMRFRPQVVVGVGGYVSLPLLWAAQQMGYPTLLHEQNKRLGMANRILARRASAIMLSYYETIGAYPKDKARVVGNPVRAGFAHPPAHDEACAKLGLLPQVPVVLVSGGSQGARTLNTAMAEAIGRFAADEAQFIWMTGNTDAEAARRAADSAAAAVKVFAFIDDMAAACAAADVIVSRAGASSTAEIALLGKPSVLIPYPHATDNHQEENARAFERAGAAIVLRDEECTGPALAEIMRGLLADVSRRAALGRAAAGLARPDAADAIASKVLELAAATFPR